MAIGTRKGFTLVEMLVALFILAIGVALVANVAASVQNDSRSSETQFVHSVVRDAVRMYYKEHEVWPAGDGGPDSSATLLKALWSTADSRAALKRLPKDAVVVDHTGRHLTDGFGRRVLYYQQGGLARRSPLLVSKGADPYDTDDDIETDLK